MEWIWGSTDKPRAARARKIKVIEFNQDEPSLLCEGSDGSTYLATLDSCSCIDFSINQKKGKPIACKHMVCLAMRLGLLNKDGLTEKDAFLQDFQNLEMCLSKAAWHYYVLDAPYLADEEYDRLKAEYLEKLRIIRSWE